MQVIGLTLSISNTSGYFFKGVWILAKKWLDKKTQKLIKIESKSGKKELLKFANDESIIPEFLGGKAKDELLDNPGIISETLNKAIKEGKVFNPDQRNLKKFFWDVDMSVPGNEFGVQPQQKKE
jgi:hypothetical protein